MRACPILYCMNVFQCLPQVVSQVLAQNKQSIREIRIRNNGFVKVNVNGRWYYLSTKNDLLQSTKGAMIVKDVCDDIVAKACNGSIYAYEKMLANGYFTLEDGVRIGVAGQATQQKEVQFKKYTSLCIRIAHEAHCISSVLAQKIDDKNVIVVGAPSTGKTTFLRDLASKLSVKYNVLVCDERGEFVLGDSCRNCDVIQWCEKQYCLNVGVRSLAPDYVVCDELTNSESDFVRQCVNSGVRLACSAHGRSWLEVTKRLQISWAFDYAVILRNTDDFELFDLRNNASISKNEVL